jgi:hypothetical protein
VVDAHLKLISKDHVIADSNGQEDTYGKQAGGGLGGVQDALVVRPYLVHLRGDLMRQCAHAKFNESGAHSECGMRLQQQLRARLMLPAVINLS